MLLLATFFSKFVVVKILIFLLNIFVFYLLFASIPLMLNWSRNLYTYILKAIFLSVLVSILSFTMIYYEAGVVYSGQTVYSFQDSLYLSISMFSNLGYGNILPKRETQIITSLESLVGILFVPTIAAYLWVYVQDRLWTEPHDANQKFEDVSLGDSVNGVFLAIEDEDRKRKRLNQFKLNKCAQCDDGQLSFLKYYDIIGLTTPFAKFMIKCKCGNLSKFKPNTYLAVWDWNKRNKPKKINIDK